MKSNQISLFSSVVDNEEIQGTLSLIGKYIDTVTWMILRVGPVIYCEYCGGSFCECNNFTPLVTHEQLAICDKYENNNDGIPAMASAFMFPLGTIFVKKERLSAILKYQMVVINDLGGYYLKYKKLEEIQELIEWNLLLAKLQRRLAYQEERRAESAIRRSMTTQLKTDRLAPKG